MSIKKNIFKRIKTIKGKEQTLYFKNTKFKTFYNFILERSTNV